MRIGITGSRDLSFAQTKQAKRILAGLLSVYGPDDELHHGDARGIDKLAKSVGSLYGMKTIAHHPKTQRWDTGYKPRNIEIVESSDFLLAIHCPDSTTNGTLWTYNYAIRKGIRCDWIELDPRTNNHR